MIKLSNRLKTIASLVYQGTPIVDVGCDHGYLCAYLIQNNIIPNAIAVDINEGPLKSCINLVNEYNLKDKISTCISDGLLNVNKNDVEQIVIAGMGGELIVKILKESPWSKEKHLILQPMTHPEILREYLYNNGFEIDNDIIVKDSNHYYCVLDANFKNLNNNKTYADYYFGNIKDFSNKEYLKHLLNYLNNKQKSGIDLNEVIKKAQGYYDKD